MSSIKGCSTCPDSSLRFNNGTGATTCSKLNERIVNIGHRVPKSRPKGCPLPAEEAAPPEQKLLDLDAIAKKSTAGDFVDDEVIDQLVAENRRLRFSLTEVSFAATNALDWLNGPMVGHDEAKKQIREALARRPR